MNAFKLDAMIEEFPFLRDTALVSKNGRSRREAKTCDGIAIKRIDADLLARTPKNYSWDGSLVGIDEWDRIDFVLSDGTVIIDAVKQEVEAGSNYAHTDTHYEDGETILEAIYNHQVADSLAFIVWAKGGYVVEGHYSQPNWSATIYKPAKDFSLTSVIIEAKERAGNEVQAETNF